MLPSDTLLTTRLHPPAARPNLVVRPRLLARLDDGLQPACRLTLVSAPAGFGKTTLVSQWAAGLARPVAWLTVDRGDTEPAVFLRYLFAALGQAAPDLSAAPAALAAALVNALAAASPPPLLALDDYHCITEYSVHDLVAFILDNQPPGFHLILITREDPPLPLARMRARGQINEIRERDLRFDLEESLEFFNRTMSLDLSPGAVAALEGRTEGWVTALQLAGVALRQHADPGAFIESFAGDDRYLVDYVMAEVLAREPEPLRDFLRQTAILDRLCAPLCDAVTGRTGSRELLDALERANLFLIPLDNRREWYRYHSLFAEVLRLSAPDAEKSLLHQRAAAWCAANGLPELAAAHQAQSAALWEAAEGARQGLPAGGLLEALSEREIEILNRIAAGDSNAEIAYRLVITVATVKRHLNNLYGKLGVHSRSRAVSRARELGLIE